MRTAEYLAERDRIVGILIARRKKLGLTQWDLAVKMAGRVDNAADAHAVSQNCSNISHWEVNRINPNLRSILNWADALGLKVTIDAAKETPFACGETDG